LQSDFLKPEKKVQSSKEERRFQKECFQKGVHQKEAGQKSLHPGVKLLGQGVNLLGQGVNPPVKIEEFRKKKQFQEQGKEEI
jgi:hypothetical protein